MAEQTYDPKAEGAYTIQRLEHVGHMMHVHAYSAEGGKLTMAMTADTFSDLGCPSVVTVTVQPGDRLNV